VNSLVLPLSAIVLIASVRHGAASLGEMARREIGPVAHAASTGAIVFITLLLVGAVLLDSARWWAAILAERRRAARRRVHGRLRRPYHIGVFPALL
jgi:hypothetical protein